ncbi:MAG: hypothetical protein HOV81_00570 [Kofleriaceae bacterium]|nr:hypothetical protein [Kofleriaceae bacterium]
MKAAQYVLIVLAGCSSSVARVTVPTDPSGDAAPAITLTAVPLVPDGPGGAGEIEPGKGDISSTSSVNVTRGSRIMLVGNARNAGGVQSFAVEAQQRGAVVFKATASDTKDASGKALNTLNVRAPDANPSGTLELTIDEPATVKAIATNFNGQTTTIDVTYVPADLTVVLTATPTEIGYQRAASSHLTWSVLYGVELSSITGNVVPGSNGRDVPARGSSDMSPKQTMTFTVTATDRSGTKSQSVTVHAYSPPPPPDPKLSAAPTDGRVCLGGEVTVTWTVANCGADCSVKLRGTGHEYALGKDYALDKLPPTGSFKFKPADRTVFELTASSQFGTKSATKTVSIAPAGGPSYGGIPGCPAAGSGNSAPDLKPFYLLIKPTDSTVQACSTVLAWFDTEANALAAARQTWGSGYTVSVIDAGQFASACPSF